MTPSDWGSLLGAIALIAVPLFTWLSGRFTREARLLQRIERLGRARAVLPKSATRDRLGSTMTEYAADLNTWIDADSRTVRILRNVVSVLAFVVALTLAVVLQPLITPRDQLGSFALFTALGVLAGLAGVVAGELIERRATTKAERRLASAKEAAFRAGTALPQPK